MSGLRWILLLTGIVFLIGLAWWERRRQHQARPAPIYGGARTEPVLSDSPMPEPRVRAGEVARVFPIVDWSQTTDERVDELPEPAAELDVAAPHLESETDEVPPMASEVPTARVIDLSEVVAGDTPALKMQWPPEAERRILALRLVTQRSDRLSGRTLRQSLSGCGFRHGPMSIFHLAVPDGRVILSAANLASPGELDPRTMDFQRFAGINLFAVLPGPLEAEATATRLVRVASEMARRLDASIQDEEGTAVEPAQLQHLATRLLARANSTPGPAD